MAEVIHMILSKEMKQRLADKLGDPENPQPIIETYKRLEDSYILLEDGEEIIVVHPPLPHTTGLTVKFSLDSLDFVGVEDWEYAKEHGEVVTWQ